MDTHPEFNSSCTGLTVRPTKMQSCITMFLAIFHFHTFSSKLIGLHLQTFAILQVHLPYENNKISTTQN